MRNYVLDQDAGLLRPHAKFRADTLCDRTQHQTEIPAIDADRLARRRLGGLAGDNYDERRASIRMSG